MANYIKGIDISNNDGSVDIAKVANAGYEYVYMKATEGTTVKDADLAIFYADCKANSLKVGAYHFLVGTSEPETQAANFYATIKDYDWDLVPMMDIETNFDGLCDYVTRFIAAFKTLSPLQLGVYTYTSFIDYLTDIQSSIKDMPFWEANYGKSEWTLSDTFFVNLVGDQYSETGLVDGVSTKCDLDSFTEDVLISNNSSTIEGTWELEDNKWWYKHVDGTYTKNGWEKIDSKWYLFDDQGYMIYDWKKDGVNWYYLGTSNDGAMKTGWIYDQNDKHWYYFNSDGVMQTGWVQVDSKWYYLNKAGAMATGWVKDGNNDFCLYSDGSMICDRDMYGYRFASNGVATKLS